MAFDHHKPSALEALHTCPALSTRIQKNRLRRSRVDQTAPYGSEYDSSLCLLWPRWMAFLGILQGCSTSSHPSRPVTATEVRRSPPQPTTLSNTIHNECDTSGEESPTEEGGAKIDEHIRSSGRLGPFP